VKPSSLHACPLSARWVSFACISPFKDHSEHEAVRSSFWIGGPSGRGSGPSLPLPSPPVLSVSLRRTLAFPTPTPPIPSAPPPPNPPQILFLSHPVHACHIPLWRALVSLNIFFFQLQISQVSFSSFSALNSTF
jgi:hypothetical protein